MISQLANLSLSFLFDYCYHIELTKLVEIRNLCRKRFINTKNVYCRGMPLKESEEQPILQKILYLFILLRQFVKTILIFVSVLQNYYTEVKMCWFCSFKEHLKLSWKETCSLYEQFSANTGKNLLLCFHGIVMTPKTKANSSLGD